MPIKDPEKRKEAARERQQKHRKGVTMGVTSEGVTGQGVTEDIPKAWANVRDFIRAESSSSMPNLEKLQRIAGSLGKNAHEVRFGLYGPTLEDIGNTIGVLPPLVSR